MLFYSHFKKYVLLTPFVHTEIVEYFLEGPKEYTYNYYHYYHYSVRIIVILIIIFSVIFPLGRNNYSVMVLTHDDVNGIYHVLV